MLDLVLLDHFHLSIANSISEDDDVGREFSVILMVLSQTAQKTDLKFNKVIKIKKSLTLGINTT